MYTEQKVEVLEKTVSELSNRVYKLEEMNKQLKAQKLYTTKDAAALIGISRSALLAHIRNGHLEATRGSGSKYARCKVSLAAIELFIEKRNKNFKTE